MYSAHLARDVLQNEVEVLHRYAYVHRSVKRLLSQPVEGVQGPLRNCIDHIVEELERVSRTS